MVFLKKFELLDENEEYNILTGDEQRNIFNSIYPLKIFSLKEFKNVDFDEITIFYGGNGSGKSTLLNIISSKLNAVRKSAYDKGTYFNFYVDRCKFEMSMDEPIEIKIITSDDIFDYLLDIRAINSNVNRRKAQLSNEYLNTKFNTDSNDFENYNKIKDAYDAKKGSMSKYIRQRLKNNNIIEQSNGESALLFWEKEINENSIYILDEPENSLSAENQIKLKKFIEESVRFYNCQFIIATHSPFLLDLEFAKIYDLDSVPVITKKWSELKNMKVYYNFFKDKKGEFEKNN